MSLSHIGCLHISLSHERENTNENFGDNFSDGRILSAILLESRSKLSHLGRPVERLSITSSAILGASIFDSNLGIVVANAK
jgi:hypothetical protein